jgi:hypothetical protein
LLDEIKSHRDIVIEIVEIIECWIELLEKYPEAVNEMNLKVLSEFMVEKAGLFYNNFEERSKKVITSDKVSVKKDAVYFYHFHSISLVLGRQTLLYPFMLVTGANYAGLIKNLCKKIEITMSFDEFINEFIEQRESGVPRLLKRDIEFIKETTSHQFTSRKEFYEFIRSRRNKKRIIRLGRLSVLGNYQAVNFPTLGLIPYMSLTESTGQVPDDLVPYINFENYPSKRERNIKVFRLFLVPVEKEEEWVEILSRMGRTGKLKEHYIVYNWKSLIRTRKGKWKWKLDFQDLKTNPGTPHGKFNFISLAKRIERITPNFQKFISTIYDTDQANPQELAAITGISKRTAYDYFNKFVDEKIILPHWQVSRIGLDALYQVFFENKESNKSLAEFLESLPKTMVMRSKEFCRFLIFLPSAAIERFIHVLRIDEENDEFETIYRGKIVLTTDYTDKKADLNIILKDQRTR